MGRDDRSCGGPGDRAGQGLPSGNVTFVFTDVEGSTGLFRRLGDRYPPLLQEQRRLIRAAVAGHGGSEVDTRGDGLFLAFGDAGEAVAACVDAQRALVAYRWPAEGQLRVRMGVHTGVAAPNPEGDYTAVAVHLAARLAAAGHGGQILMSAQTADLLRRLLPATALVNRGAFVLPGFDEAEPIFQLVHPDLPSSFPPLLAAPAIAHNLPDVRTSFIGRDNDLKSVDELLRTARLVTLVGPGGAGKTRLCLELAARLAPRFQAGAQLSDPLPADPALVEATVASLYGVRDTGGGDLMQAVGAELAGQSALLVLDNCEHVLDAAAVAVERRAASAPGYALWPPAGNRSAYKANSSGGSRLCCPRPERKHGGNQAQRLGPPLRRPGPPGPALFHRQRAKCGSGGDHLRSPRRPAARHRARRRPGGGHVAHGHRHPAQPPHRDRPLQPWEKLRPPPQPGRDG